jgi:hypothetical protein
MQHYHSTRWTESLNWAHPAGQRELRLILKYLQSLENSDFLFAVPEMKWTPSLSLRDIMRKCRRAVIRYYAGLGEAMMKGWE